MKLKTSKHAFPTTRPGQQTGMVLVISLILLVVLTLVAVVAMRSTNVDMQMTTNTLLKSRAFQNAESGRQLTTRIIGDHVYHRGWTGFDLPDGLAPVDSDSELYLQGAATVDEITDPDRAANITYQVDGDGDSNFNGRDDINAEISALRTATIPAPGADASQLGGYSGTGGGAAGAGAYLLFDIRSKGTAPGNARAATGIDYRHVVTN